MGSWAAANFVFDLALLWATARLLARRVPLRRLALGAASGTACFLVLPTAGAPLPAAASLAGACCLMVAATFGARPARALFTAAAVFHGVAFVAAGAGALAAGLLGEPAAPQPVAGAAAALAVIAAIAAVGLHSARRMAVLAALQVRLELRFGDRWVTLNGLVDTGNHLREPVGRLPVVLAWHGALRGVLPSSLQPILQRLAGGELEDAGRLAALDPRWGARLRLIPFRSVGTEHGLLAGLRADAMRVEAAGRPPVDAGPVVVALAAAPLAGEGDFEALVPADCVLPALAPARPAGGSRRPRVWKGGAVGAGTRA